MEKKSEYLSEIWGYHNRQNEDYLYFTDITFVFLSLFSATVTSNVRNGKSQVVLTQNIPRYFMACSKQAIDMLQCPYFISDKQWLNKIFFQGFQLQLKKEQMTIFTS